MAEINFNSQNKNNINVKFETQETINTKLKDLNYIPDYKAYEEERQLNELNREANEEERIKYYEEIQRLFDNNFKGVGIKTIEKTDTTGLVDTYTITYDDNTTTTYQVTNGEPGPQGEPGEPGEKGEKGDKGEPGETPDLSEYAKLSDIPANEVVISPTEPTTGEEVWIKKSSNLFNVNTPTTKYSINSSGEQVISSDGFDYINQKIEVTGSITVSWESVITTPTIRIAQYTAGGTFISRPYVLPYSETSPKTINLDSNTGFIIVSVEHNDIDKVINLQIEKGTNATPYEPFVEKAICVKNDSGNYEEYIKPQVKVSAEELTTGEEVWVKKGNNLWNAENPFVVNVGKQANIPLKAGTYTLSVESVTGNSPSYTSHVGFLKADGSTSLIVFLPKVNDKKITFTLKEDIAQIDIWSGDYWNNSSGYQTTYNNLMLVKGDEALPYEPYVDKEIYVKNGNGVYEEFYNEANLEKYSTNEQKIGTWFDGKPLYRKVINFGALPNTNTKEVATNISSLNTVTKISGIAKYGEVFLALPYGHKQTDLNISLAYNKGKINIDTGNDRSNYSAYVIIEYTKN